MNYRNNRNCVTGGENSIFLNQGGEGRKYNCKILFTKTIKKIFLKTTPLKIPLKGP